MSDEQHMAMPRLYGGPAYSRPPRPVEVIVRPFDPDELPLEADRTDEDAASVDELTGNAWAPSSALASKGRRSRRGRAGKQARNGKAATQAVVAGPDQGNRAELEGRPLRLRGLGHLFSGARNSS